MQKKENIIVLFGGSSAEREVSILTGLQMLNMCPKEFNAIPVFLDENDRFFVPKNKPKVPEKSGSANNNGLHPSLFASFNKNNFHEVIFSDNHMHIKRGNKFAKLAFIDAAINACHGGFGENGGLSALLTEANIPHSVGDHVALGIAMDKAIAKRIFRDQKIPVLPSFEITNPAIEFVRTKTVGAIKPVQQEAKNNNSSFANLHSSSIKALGFPIVIKPARQGSSVGVSMCKNAKEFDEAIALALEFDSKILAEKGLKNFREFNCAVMNDSVSLLVSEVEEPIKDGEILSFSDKYLSGAKNTKPGTKSQQNTTKTGKIANSKGSGMESSNRVFPAKIPTELKEKIQNIAKTAIKAIGLEGVSRLDFLFDGNKLYLNEINAIPGSLAFYFFKETFPGEAFFSKLVQLSKTRDATKKKATTPYAKFL